MNTTKQNYNAPRIERIVLDNEISLTLDSTTPPAAPFESGVIGSLAPDYFNVDPFKTNLG